MAGVNLIGTGETYTTIGAWESAFNTSSLSGVEEGQLKAEQFSEVVLLDGGTTTSVDYCHLTTASGAEFNHITKTGARIVLTGITANTDVVMIKDPFHRWGGNTANNGSSTGAIGIRYESLTGAYNCSAMRMRQAGSNVIKQLVMYDCVSGGNAYGYRDDGSNSAGRIDLYNSSAINIETTSVVGGDAIGFNRDGGAVNSYTHYCNAHDIRAGSSSDDAIGFNAMAEANNCWAGECVSLSPAGQSDGFFATGSMTTCASSDATGTIGLQNLLSVDQFISSVAPYDLHLKTGSGLINTGSDIYSVVFDIDGSVSGARDDIGFDELVSSGFIVDSDGSVVCLYKRKNNSNTGIPIARRGTQTNTLGSDVGFSSQVATNNRIECLFNTAISAINEMFQVFVGRLDSSLLNTVSNSSELYSIGDNTVVVGGNINETLIEKLRHSGIISGEKHLPLLWSGSLSTISDLVTDIFHASSVQYSQDNAIATSSGIVIINEHNLLYKNTLSKHDNHVVGFSQLITLLENLPTLYLGGLGITSDSKFDVVFSGISQTLATFLSEIKAETHSSYYLGVGYKEATDRVEDVILKYNQILDSAENISLLWGGGIGVDSTSRFPIIHRGSIEQYQSCDVTSSAIIATSKSTSVVFKQRTEISVEEAIGYLADIGMNASLLSNFSSVLIVREDVSVKWSNIDDALYIDGDAELWVLNERGTVWRLF